MWREKNKVKLCCNLAAIASPVEVGTPSATEEDYGLEFHISPNAADKVGGLGSVLETWSHRILDGAVIWGVRVEACASVDPQEYTLLHTWIYSV